VGTNAVKLTDAQLIAAFKTIATKHHIDGYNAMDYPKDSVEHVAESIGHELAHGFVLRGKPCTTSDIGNQLKWPRERVRVSVQTERRERARADSQEFSTLRVEVAALAKLGVVVDGDVLRRNAGFNGRPPGRKRFNAPLTAKEKNFVRKFVALVRSAARAPSLEGE
jgi:hypothetical protein